MNNDKNSSLPILALKKGVFFPTGTIPLTVGRPASIRALEAALESEEKELIVLTQKDPALEDVGKNDLRSVGTRAVIQQAARPNEDIMQVVVQGLERVELVEIEQTEPYLKGKFKILPLMMIEGSEVEALRRELAHLALQVAALSDPMAAGEIAQVMADTPDQTAFLYLIASVAHPDTEAAQRILESPDLLSAMKLAHEALSHELQVLKVQRDIAKQTQREMNKQQREYLLRQNLHAIREELGEKSPEEADATQLRKRFEEAKLPDDVRQEADRELDRLCQTPQASPEYSVIRTYLDYLLELPWNTLTKETLDIPRARKILDDDHYGLKDVKERILEHLGVMKLNPGAKSPILCFVGPPGVGKTSVGQSIAKAIGRKFERMSLGGLHDEAELRGHRRTYIGALPGHIIQAIRRVGSRNPLLMLDEVDKLGQDFHGDPASALLEILDPDQNFSFRDNYLDLPFDLSKVFFILTANTIDTIPSPLLDRMEILRLPGYSNLEKKEIAEKYLIPRELSQMGLTKEKCDLGPGVLETIIARYTREAGVRQLERTIGRAFRKVALKFAENTGQTPVNIAVDDLGDYLGPPSFFEESVRRVLTPGVAAGMAWTEAGGEVMYVECALLPDSRGLTLTGQLGEVMQESAKAAHTYIWSHADQFGIQRAQLRRAGVHLHVPAGAVPKDGPSAGVTMAAALTSLYTGLPARSDTAMTGEITLSGLVLPIGGVKEKVLAAHRAQMKRVLLPRENQKDLKDIPEHVRQAMEFIYVNRVEDVLLAVIPGLEQRQKERTVPVPR